MIPSLESQTDTAWNAGLIAGHIAGWAVAYVFVALFLVFAWGTRPSERAYMLFALGTGSLALYTLGFAITVLTGAHGEPAGALAAIATRLTICGAFATDGFLLLGAMEYAGVAAPRLRAALSAFTSLGIVAAGAGLIFDEGAIRHVRLSTFGLAIESWYASPTPLGAVLLSILNLVAIALFVLFLRAWRAGHREAVAALVGVVVLQAASLHDSMVVAGVAHGIWLSPHGFGALVFGIAFSLATRFSKMSLALDRSNEELRAAQDALVEREQLAAIGEVAAVMAHEVRNPLAVVRNAVAGLRRKEIDAEHRGTLLAILDEEAGRIDGIVGHLLSYSRPIELRLDDVALRELLDRSAFSARTDAVPIELVEDGGPFVVRADASLLRQAFDNLVDNAVQAGGTRVVVRVAAGRRPDVVDVVVSDDGAGMSPEAAARARDPFFTTRATGTGLGLAIVDRVVDAHRGVLEIESAPGRGTAVRVSLPRRGPAAR